jgi:hypothetical protein
MLIFYFFDYRAIVHHGFVPSSQTVNEAYCLEVLSRVRDAMRRKRPEMWTAGTWYLHHDNAPAHTAVLIREMLAKRLMPVRP